MVAKKKKGVKPPVPKGRASIYKGTDSSAKGGNKKLGPNIKVNSSNPMVIGAAEAAEYKARGQALLANRAAKGKGMRGQATTVGSFFVGAGAGTKGAMIGGRKLKNTLTKAPKDARRAK
jgi:hypothetical protein